MGDEIWTPIMLILFREIAIADCRGNQKSPHLIGTSLYKNIIEPGLTYKASAFWLPISLLISSNTNKLKQ